MTTFWDDLLSLPLANEAEIEQRLVLPMLGTLGYNDEDIAPKYPVIFQEGRSGKKKRAGRKPEADYVVFYGPERSLSNSLITIEAKAPGEAFGNAKAQAESYAQNMRTPFYLSRLLAQRDAAAIKTAIVPARTPNAHLDVERLSSRQGLLPPVQCRVEILWAS